jgi:hypothetical protein
MSATTVRFLGDQRGATWSGLLRDFLEAMVLAQMPENGFRRAKKAYIKDGPPFFDANGNALYATTTCDEEVYIENAVQACALELEVPVPGGTDALASKAFWIAAFDDGREPAASDYLAVRPVPRSSTPYLAGAIPARNHYDNSEIALVCALAKFNGQDSPENQRLVGRISGNPTNPLAGLLSKPLNQHVDDTCFLISALQKGL